MLSKIPLLLLSLAAISSVQAFRFQGQEDTTVDVKPKETAVAEETENVESDREAKKIDPLVIDVERKPIVSEDESTSTETEAEPQVEAEGRFFLKDKLCALGLADVSTQPLIHHWVFFS